MRGMCRQTVFVRVRGLATGALVVVLGLTQPAWGQCDPQELAQLVAADAAAEDWFGGAVAMDGDTAIVGAEGDDNDAGVNAGAAYVFMRTGTTWVQVAKLTASDGQAEDGFGTYVAVQGDTVVIGAYRGDRMGAEDTGAAYVFVRSNGVWAQQAKLTSTTTQAGDRFGHNLAIDGDIVLIGATEMDRAGGDGPGSAYVFVRSGETWAEQARLNASDGDPGDGFGIEVAVSGDTALVGAYADQVGEWIWAGSAYVFVRSGTGWAEEAKLVAPDASNIDIFGSAVALVGDTALVGAQNDSFPGGVVHAGSVRVFERIADGWIHRVKLVASDAARNDHFGVSIALANDMAVIGAYWDSHSGGDYAGSAYVFTRSGAVWGEAGKMIASDAAPSDDFGVCVALSGDTAVIGAGQGDVAGMADAGSAYIFDLNCLVCPGDLDCDGQVAFLDINPFVLRLSNPSAYVGMYPDCPDRNADIDGNGAVDFGDINPFVTLLSTQSLPAACP